MFYQILLSERPEYINVIEAGYLLAPAVFMTNADNPIFLLTQLAETIEDIFHWLGLYEFLPSSPLIAWLAHQVCDDSSAGDVDICSNFAFAFFGINPDQFNS